MLEKNEFSNDFKEVARFSKAISHPARLAILQYLADTKTCISGDISDHLPLSRSTVFQHLKELKKLGLIRGEIDGLKVNYCLCNSKLQLYKDRFDSFFKNIIISDVDCKPNC